MADSVDLNHELTSYYYQEKSFLCLPELSKK
jgi:hypothetical protein